MDSYSKRDWYDVLWILIMLGAFFFFGLMFARFLERSLEPLLKLGVGL